MKKMIALMAAAPDRSIEEPLSRRDSSGGGGRSSPRMHARAWAAMPPTVTAGGMRR
jgi:hypothetical protein